MSKTRDALRRAQREEAAHKEGGTTHEVAPRSKASERKKDAEDETRPLKAVPEIVEATPGPTVAHEKLTSRVSVGDLTAQPGSILEEQFRKLKGTITTLNLARGLRSVLVMSCLAGEGKTMVSLNLATIIAKGMDHSALLIDADLRKTNLTSMLGLKNAFGLSDLLEERVTLEEVLVDTEIEGLTVLPAGVNRANPAELIDSNRMRRLLQQLKEKDECPYIILDSTPIISTSESSSLSQMVDGVVVVIMADKTRRDVVRRELRTINPGKLLGVILNCAEFETSDYYRNYYQQYATDQD
jgi:capsular exopolysaccharide synthesis family protein